MIGGDEEELLRSVGKLNQLKNSGKVLLMSYIGTEEKKDRRKADFD